MSLLMRVYCIRSPGVSTNESILYKVPWCSTNEIILYKVPWCSTNENILYKVPWCSTNEIILYKVPWCSTNEVLLYLTNTHWYLGNRESLLECPVSRSTFLGSEVLSWKEIAASRAVSTGTRQEGHTKERPSQGSMQGIW